jgi:hypothetical protein
MMDSKAGFSTFYFISRLSGKPLHTFPEAIKSLSASVMVPLAERGCCMPG